MALVSPSFSMTRNAVLSLASPPDSTPAQESWENEGGHLLGKGGEGESQLPAVTAFACDETERLTADVHLMKRALLSDFANGRIGSRYNTYEHRSRVLRQLIAELDAVNADFQDRSKDDE